MHTIKDCDIAVTVSDDGDEITLRDIARSVRWRLDPATPLATASPTASVPFACEPSRSGAVAFETGEVERRGDRALLVTRDGPNGRAVFRYELTPEGLRVTLLAARSTVTAAALPGAFRPQRSKAPCVALPKNQGIWHRGTGGPFRFNMRREGHGGFSMPFFAVVGERDALVTIIEAEADAGIWFEKTADGRIVASALADPSLGRIAYDRSALVSFTDPDLTSICGAYRRYIENGKGLTTWEEKIAKRPNVERLFGALMCFVGYCQDEKLDYAASFRQLKAMGFDRAYVYPLAIGNLVEGFQMGGLPPIDQRRHLPLIEELGYISAAWMWTEDIPRSDEDCLLTAGGDPDFGWQIDEVKWFRACPVRQVGISNAIQDSRMKGFTGHHFDVTASRAALECHHPDHPIDRREDEAWRRKVLGSARRRGLVVSSEGFWGTSAADYDIGSVKIALPLHEHWYTVPMTSLVYHDSLIHDWWEVDNYNNPHHRAQFGRGENYFPLGGGYARLQAAQDALAGWPPNVMPFGAQYAFIEGEMAKGTELYRYSLDSPEVQEALELALPVARLHRRIGKTACVAHETLAPGGALQVTTFADGTRVAANFSEEPAAVDDVGIVAAESWRASLR